MVLVALQAIAADLLYPANTQTSTQTWLILIICMNGCSPQRTIYIFDILCNYRAHFRLQLVAS